MQTHMERLPLEGTIVIVTRPRHQAEEFSLHLRGRGAEVVFFPTIEIVPPESWDDVDAAIDQNRAYDAFVFTSSNAARYFFERARERGIGFEQLMGKTMYALGRKTAEAVSFYGMRAVTFPGVGNAHELAAALTAGGAAHRRYLVPKGRRAGSEIVAVLRANGAAADEVIVYDTVMPQTGEGTDASRVAQALSGSQSCVITFFSPSSVENYFALMPERPPAGAVIAAIGETTALALKGMGLAADIVPDHPRADEFAAAIERFVINNALNFTRNEEL